MRKITNGISQKVNGYKKEQEELRQKVIKQMFTLATAGFGLVAALAWNEAIKTFFSQYVDKYVKVGGVVFSRFLYAFVVTILAVLITYQLSKLSQRFEEEERKD